MSNCPTPGKISYISEDMAIRFGVQARMRWYCCPCTKWHLTTSSVNFDYIDQVEASLKQAERERVAQAKVSKAKKPLPFTPIAVGTTVEHKQYGIGVVRYVMPSGNGKTVKCDWLETPSAVHKVINVQVLRTLTNEEARKATQSLVVYV